VGLKARRPLRRLVRIPGSRPPEAQLRPTNPLAALLSVITNQEERQKETEHSHDDDGLSVHLRPMEPFHHKV
jgi:hypothetical protein